MAIETVTPYWQTLPGIFTGLGAVAETATNFGTADTGPGWVFRVPKTGTLKTFEFRTNIINVPDNPLRISFRAVDASGNPAAVTDEFRDITIGSTGNQWVVPGLVTSDGTDTGTKRSVTVGDYMAVVIRYTSFVASDSFQIQQISAGGAITVMTSYFTWTTNNESTWNKASHFPMVALIYDDDSVANISPQWYPIKLMNTTAFNSGSTPDERGNRFQYPIEARINALWVRCAVTAAADVVIYDDADSAVFTDSLVSGKAFATSGGNYYIPVGGLVIPAETVYRVVVKPTSGSNISTYDFDVDRNALLAPTPLGVEAYYTQRTDAGAWTDTNTKRMWIGLEVDGVDSGGGGQRAYAF